MITLTREKFFLRRADSRTKEIRRIDDEIARIRYQVGGAYNPAAERRISSLEASKKQFIEDRARDLFHKGRR